MIQQDQDYFSVQLMLICAVVIIAFCAIFPIYT